MANKFFKWINRKINGTEVPNTQQDETPVDVDSVVEEHIPDVVPGDEEIQQEPEKPQEEEKPRREVVPTAPSVGEEIPAVEGNNPIEKKSNLIQLITKQVKHDYRGVNVDLQNHVLYIIVTDGVLYSIINNKDFVSQLNNSIINESDCSFSKIKLGNQLPENHHYKTLVRDVFYDVETQQTEEVGGENIKRARITAIQGSMKADKVILDSQEIATLKDARYNIGAMSQPYPTRTNQIAIDETDDSQAQYNKYASREHAHIAYNETHGFLLFADRGGVRENRMRTHIVRCNEWIEVEGTLLPKILKDGDLIVLSRNVHLLFEVIK